MSPRLVYFLTKMGENLELRRAYVRDPRKVMAANGLTKKEQDLLLGGDEAAILGAASGDFVICKTWEIAPTDPQAAGRKKK